jgi:phasin family protein
VQQNVRWAALKAFQTNMKRSAMMNTRPAIPEQISAANKVGVDVALRAAGIAFEGVERLMELNLNTAKAAFAENAKVAKSITSVKDVKELLSVNPAVIQPVVDRNTAYLRGLWEIASDTQGELAKLMEERVTHMNKTVVATLDKAAKSGPAGSDVAVAAVKSAIAAANSAYDSAVKAAKQVADLTEANVAAASQVVSMPKKKAAA